MNTVESGTGITDLKLTLDTLQKNPSSFRYGEIEPIGMSEMQETLGNTPLVLLQEDSGSRLFAKLEASNPTGSIKARTAFAMLKDALDNSQIGPKGIVVNSGGNFALALACLCRKESIPLTVSLLSSAPSEFRKQLENLGATVIAESATRPERRELTLELAEKGYCFLDQHNSAVALSAIETTLGPELYRQTNGNITDIVAGFGTGMTVFGTSRYFRSLQKLVRIAAVEDDISLLSFHVQSLSVVNKSPEEKFSFLTAYQKESKRKMRIYKNSRGAVSSVVFYAGVRAVDDIPGIGISGLQPFTEELIQKNLIDNVIQISPKDARDKTRFLQSQGLYVGISSGATYLAAQEIFAERLARNEQCSIVAIFADSGKLYEQTLYEKQNRNQRK